MLTTTPLESTIVRAQLIELIKGGIAQLARAFGSYPEGHWFKSSCRYHSLQILAITHKARWSSG